MSIAFLINLLAYFSQLSYGYWFLNSCLFFLLMGVSDTWRKTSHMVQLVGFITSGIWSWKIARFLPLTFALSLIHNYKLYSLILFLLFNISLNSLSSLLFLVYFEMKCVKNLILNWNFVWQSHIFLLNCDVCCSFPLPEMLGNCFLLVKMGSLFFVGLLVKIYNFPVLMFFLNVLHVQFFVRQ